MKKFMIAIVLLFLFIYIMVACSKKKIPYPTDSINVTNTITSIFTFTPTSTPTATGTPTSNFGENSLYHFEDGTTMGWNTYLNNVTRTSNSTDRAFWGTHSLRLDGAFQTTDSSGAGVDNPLITDITGKILKMRIWIPPDFPAGSGGAIYIQSGSGWCWQNGWSNLTAGIWNELTFDPANPVYTGQCTPDHTDVKRIGVQFLPASPYTGSVYIDSLEVIDLGIPTNTGTPTYTKTITGTPTNTKTPGGPTDTDTPTPTVTPTYIYTPGKPNDPAIQYYGRWDLSNPYSARNGWGTTYLITGFTGTSIKINISAWDVWFAYAIDDFSDHTNFIKFEVKNQYDQYQTIPTPTQTPLIISGLADTNHTIMIVRRTEGMGGIINFTGFELDPGKVLFNPGNIATRKMEFIGDSITCGSHNEWQGSNPCPEQWGNCIQNGDMSFGPQLARMFNAQWRTISRGGIGMYRNCNGCDPPATMPTVFPNLFFEMTPTISSPKWDFNSWQADVVVIALGTNDFSGGVPDENGFKSAYSDFLTELRGYYPNAYILCTEPIPSWVSVYAGQWIQSVVTNKSDARIFYVPINNPASPPYTPLQSSDYAGDNTHPIVSGHTKIATVLYNWINANIYSSLQATHGW